MYNRINTELLQYLQASLFIFIQCIRRLFSWSGPSNPVEVQYVTRDCQLVFLIAISCIRVRRDRKEDRCSPLDFN